MNNGSDFNTPANWVTSNPVAGDRAFIAGGLVNPVVSSTISFTGINFFTPGMTLSGTTISLTSTVTNNPFSAAISMLTPGVSTISAPILLTNTIGVGAGFGAEIVLSGSISGAFNIQKLDWGTLTISGNNTGFTGTLNANGGNGNFGVSRVNLNSNNALGTGVLVVGQGNGGSQMGNTSGSAHTLSNSVVLDTSGASNWYLGQGDLTFTGVTTFTNVNANGAVNVWGGALAFRGGVNNVGTGNLIKGGDGALVLSGNNTYTGLTQMNGGTLILDFSPVATTFSSSITSLNDSSVVLKGASGTNVSQSIAGASTTMTFNRNTGLTVNANGGTATLTVQNTWARSNGAVLNIALADGNSFLASNPTLQNGVVAVGSVAFATVTDPAGTGFATVSGGNVVRYTGASTLAGTGNVGTVNYITSGTTLTGSQTMNTLQIDGAGGTGVLDLGGVTQNFTSRAILMTGADNFTIQNGQLGSAETVIHQFGSGTLFVNSNIFGPNKAGTGVMVFSGSALGGTVVNNGVLNVTGFLGNGAAVQGGQLNLQNAGAFHTGVLSTAGTGKITQTVANAITGATSVSVNGFGSSVTLSHANNYTGNTTVTSGTLNINNAAAIGSGTLVISGGYLDNTSGGAITLSTNNNVNLTASLYFIGSNNLDLGAGIVSTNNGVANVARLFLVESGTLTLGTGLVKAGGGTGVLGFSKSGAGTLVLNGAGTYDGGTILEGGLLVANHASALTSVGTMRMSNAVLGLGAADFTRAVGTGVGEVTLFNSSGFAAFNGNRVVNLGGAGATVTWNSGGFLVSPGSSQGTVLILGDESADGTLDFQNAINLNGTTTSTRVIEARDGSAKVDGRVSGAISGGANLGKIGDGTLELTAANTYTGATAIAAGTLLVSGNGSINTSSAVTVARGATFAYTSSVNHTATTNWNQGSTLGGTNWNGSLGGVTVSSAAGGPTYITPGTSPGTANTTTQTWGTGGGYIWEINDFNLGGEGTTWDLLNLTGTLSITATELNRFNIFITSLNGENAGNAANFNDLNNYQLLIADAGSTITSFDADLFNLDTSAFTNAFSGAWSIVRGDNAGVVGGNDSQIYLLYNAIPEPSTVLLMGLGATVLLFGRRRKMA